MVPALKKFPVQRLKEYKLEICRTRLRTCQVCFVMIQSCWKALIAEQLAGNYPAQDSGADF